MKSKLLVKLRNRGRNVIDVLSVTKEGNTVVGMSYSFTGDEYSGLFHFGQTESEVRNEAARIYIETNIDKIRKRYKKYSRLK